VEEEQAIDTAEGFSTHMTTVWGLQNTLRWYAEDRAWSASARHLIGLLARWKSAGHFL
jgi:hypothetical protein